MPRRFVLLDRDGTLNVERHYLSDPSQVQLLSGVGEGLRRMRSLGLGLAVVTNQSGVGRGLFDMERLDQVHGRLRALLSAEGVEIDGFYVCPHRPDQGCACRKPLPGLIEAAAAQLGFDAADSFVIGDKPCDIDMGQAVGAYAMLVRSGYGAKYATDAAVRPDYVVDDLIQAAHVVERRLRFEGYAIAKGYDARSA